MSFLKDKKTQLLLLAVIAIAIFFRLYRLNSLPPGLYPDVAINGNDALDSLETLKFKVFYPENNGREGLFFWLIALSFWIFGPGIWAIKIVAAIFGILTVLGTYLLTKELFNLKFKNEAIALIASFFLAISFWHVNFSRIGFRAIMLPFFLTFSFYFLWKGFSRKKTYNVIISGIFLGLGFYTYISYRFVIFILATSLLFWWFVYKKEKAQKQFWKFVVYGLSSLIIFALPIGIYFLTHLQDFSSRAADVLVFSQPNPVFLFLKSLVIHLGMFNFYGDANWRHNFAGSPQLLWPVGIFFLIGFFLSVKKFIVSIKNKNGSEFTVYGLLLSWFFFMLLPGALSYEGMPHALRTIGVIPVPYIFAGLGAFWIFEKISVFYKTRNQKIIFAVIIFIFLFSLAGVEFDKYFYQWAGNRNVKGAFSENLAKIGDYLNSLPNDLEKYVIVNQSGVAVPYPDGLPMPAQTSMFIERIKYGKIRSNYILPDDLEKIKIEKSGIIILLQYDESLMGKIIFQFPHGKLEKNQGIWVYKINN